ncbi:MAG: hypothetical protein AB7G23_20720 [Vicinamibacterales bacterium]
MRAGEDASQAGALDPDAIARLILEDDGPQQALVAQAMRDADAETILRVHEAVRRLAPEISKEKAARGAEPDLPEVGDGPLHLVNVEVRFLDAEANFLRDVSVDMRGPDQPARSPAAEGDAGVTYLDDAQLEVILRAVEKSVRVTQVTAPRITVYDRQRANVSVLNEKSFVADVERVDRGDGARAAKPVVEIAQEGLVLNLRPTLSADRRYITLELALLMAELIERDAPRAVVCEGKTIALTMPKTHLHHMRAAVRIPDEGTVMINQGVRSGGKSRLLIVTARHVEMSAQELREAIGEQPGGIEEKPDGK